MEQRKKASYVGAPAIFALEQACRELRDAFGGFGCFLVGSALERADWRDVDLRYILSDSEFAALFPDAGQRNAIGFRIPKTNTTPMSDEQQEQPIATIEEMEEAMRQQAREHPFPPPAPNPPCQVTIDGVIDGREAQSQVIVEGGFSYAPLNKTKTLRFLVWVCAEHYQQLMED